MRKGALLPIIAAVGLACLLGGCRARPAEDGATGRRIIVASDTILSGMIASLMPPGRYSVEAILPPGQCPGHYDVKLTDIAKVKRAALTVSLRDMPFMNKAVTDGGAHLLLDTGGRNWMTPDSYVYGLNIVAEGLAVHFPEERARIMARKERAALELNIRAGYLRERIRRSGTSGKAVLASSMQKETVEWMGFRVVGEYGRQEAMSAKDVAALLRIGRDRRAVMIVDNLQSGPDEGRGIAETLKVPHVVLTNFPSEKGYLATLEENVNAVLEAMQR